MKKYVKRINSDNNGYEKIGMVAEVISNPDIIGFIEVRLPNGNENEWMSVNTKPCLENGDDITASNISKRIEELVEMLTETEPEIEDVTESVGWVNYYTDRVSNYYPTKRCADINASPDRIKCEEITHTVSKPKKVETPFVFEADVKWAKIDGGFIAPFSHRMIIFMSICIL